MPDNSFSQLNKATLRVEVEGVVAEKTDRLYISYFLILSKVYKVLTLWESNSLIPPPS